MAVRGVSVVEHMKGMENTLVTGRVNKVPAHLIVPIEQRKTRLLVHRSVGFCPFVADAHGAEAYGRDAHACARGEDAVVTELGRWLGGDFLVGHC